MPQDVKVLTLRIVTTLTLHSLNVESLRLSGNNLNETIPEGLYGLSNLQDFELMENSLSGTLSSRVGDLVLLTRLLVHRN